MRDRELGNSIKQLARHTDEQFAEVHQEMGRFAAYVEQQITGIVTSVDELTRAGVETAIAVDTLRDAIGLLAARTESGLQNLTTIVSERETLLRGELQTIADAVRQLASVTHHRFAGTSTRRLLVASAAEVRDAMALAGYSLFADDEGQGPLGSSAVSHTITKQQLDVIWRTWLTASRTSNATAYRDPIVMAAKYEIYCDAEFLLKTAGGWLTWLTLTRALGPFGCQRSDTSRVQEHYDSINYEPPDPDPLEGVACQCWIATTVYSCPLVQGDATQYMQHDWLGEPWLQEDSSLCEGQRERVSGGMALDMLDWHEILYHSCTDFPPVSAVAIQLGLVDGDTRGKYNLYSTTLRTGMFGGVPFRPDVVCPEKTGVTVAVGQDEEQAWFGTPTRLLQHVYNAAPRESRGYEENVVAAIYNTLELAYTRWTWNATQVENDLYGRLPGGTQTKSIPFGSKAIKGRDVSYRCDYASLVGVRDGAFEPVYAMQPVFTAAKAVATEVLDRVDTTVLDARTAIASVPAQSLIPEQLLIFGSPAAAFRGSPGRVYDIPDNEVSLSPDVTARETKVTYLMTNIPGDTPSNQARQRSYKEWKASNGPLFDSFSAGNCAALYEREIVPDQPARWYSGSHASPSGMSLRCSNRTTGSSRLLDGPICQLLKWFRVRLPDDEPGTPLRLIPKEYRTIFTLEVPTGEIKQMVFTDCPIISTGTTTRDRVSLLFNNPNGQSIEFLLEIIPLLPNNQTENCHHKRTVTIAGSGYTQVDVPPCRRLDGITRVPIRARVYTHDIDDNGDRQPRLCGTELNATVPLPQELGLPATLSDLPAGLVESGEMVVWSTVVHDSTARALAQIGASMSESMAALAAVTQLTLKTSGFNMDDMRGSTCATSGMK
ncbi:MAG: hypothetical protein GY703_17545 [Gammaproteobacteria bacterium]|nr:hypothetical protein [Gammaproteobacteria bacterium]